jgi:two-component system LytT family sensor kinase
VRRRAVAAGQLPGRAALLAQVVDAENAVRADGGAASLARSALHLSAAESVWLRLDPTADICRAGSRKGSERAAAILAGATAGAGFWRYRIGDVGAVVFRFDSAAGAPAAGAPVAGVPVAGAEAAADQSAGAAVAAWIDLRLAERTLAGEPARAARAELRALRAQISPHFLFNAMGAIAALIRIDPVRAHELLLDFADYTRYSFGRRGEYTSLAEELRSIEIYLALERARFGERLSVHVTIPPEVLGVPVPFLVLQPLVENAIRHGIEPLPGGGRVIVSAEDAGSEIRIEVEDNGAGSDPGVFERLLGASEPAPSAAREHVGLRNIDERMRAVYGDAYGLVIDTAPGAGTKITLTIPKYRTDVQA